MGIKFLTSQMMPWCFYMPSSHCHHSSDDDDGPSATPAASGTVSSSSASSASTIRLIMSDGRVRIYRRPVKAAELAAEFPKHLVCRSDAFCIGQKVPALPEDEQLQPGHSYFLLPTQFFQSVLSFVTVAASFARAAEATGGGKATLMKAFDVHKTPSGALQIRVSDEFIQKIRTEKEEGEEAEDVEDEGSSQRSRVCTTAALEKDYRQLVRCRDQLWKPKLETISESRKKRLDTFSSFRRKNKETQQNHKVPAPPPPPPPPPRLPVITTKLVKTKEPFSSFKRRKNKETAQQNDKLPTPPPPPPPPRPPMTTTKLVKTKGKQKLRSGKEC